MRQLAPRSRCPDKPSRTTGVGQGESDIKPTGTTDACGSLSARSTSPAGRVPADFPQSSLRPSSPSREERSPLPPSAPSRLCLAQVQAPVEEPMIIEIHKQRSYVYKANDLGLGNKRSCRRLCHKTSQESTFGSLHRPDQGRRNTFAGTKQR